MQDIKSYTKRPVTIQALLFDGDNFGQCEQFIGKENYDSTLKYPNIKTLEGTMEVSKGDYIIKGIEGEFYPCKPEIFKKSYSPAGGAQPIDFQELFEDEKRDKRALLLENEKLIKEKAKLEDQFEAQVEKLEDHIEQLKKYSLGYIMALGKDEL